MKIAVRYLAQLRQAAGVEGEEIEGEDPCPLQHLLMRLADRHDEHFRRMLLDKDNALQPGILVFVGEEQIRADMPMQLKDGDVITLLTPMAGG